METKPRNSSSSGASKRPYKRHVRNVFIHKPMQREFSFMLIVLLIVTTFAVGWVIHQSIREAAFGGGFQFGKVNPYQILSEVSYTIIMRVTLILFATLIVIGWYGILFLHRVAGPVYRFRQTLLKVNRGELPGDVRLREGDFFIETAHEINGVLKKLRTDQEKIDNIKDKLGRFLKTDLSDEAKRKAEEMMQVVDEMARP